MTDDTVEVRYMVGDVGAEVERLRAAGLTFRNQIVKGPGGSQVLVDDPPGNPIELFEPRGGAVRIRKGEGHEAARLREITIAAKGHWGYDPDLVRTWAAGDDFSPAGMARKDVHVAEVDGRLVGWAALVPQGEVYWLEDLWVEPDWIGKGIGRRLFRHAAERAQLAGARSMEWEAEPNAVGFYEAMGARYSRDSEPSEWGRILPVMRVELASDAPRRVEVVPQLSVRRGRDAIEFYKAAFGAVEVYRVGGTDENPDVVAQLAIGAASFWVSDEAPAHENYSPESVGGGTVRMLLVVDDPDEAVRRAVAAGAAEIYPVGEEHGWRLGRIKDPFGHHWEIGKPLVPWPPAGGRPHPTR